MVFYHCPNHEMDGTESASVDAGYFIVGKADFGCAADNLSAGFIADLCHGFSHISLAFGQGPMDQDIQQSSVA